MRPLYLFRSFWGEDWEKGQSLLKSLPASGVVLSLKDIVDSQGSIDRFEVERFVSLRSEVRYWALEVPLGYGDVFSGCFRPWMEALGICCAVLGMDWLVLRGSFCPPPSLLEVVSGELDYLSWFLSCSGIGLCLHPYFPLGIRGDVVGYSAFWSFFSFLDSKVAWWASGMDFSGIPGKLRARIGGEVVGVSDLDLSVFRGISKLEFPLILVKT